MKLSFGVFFLLVANLQAATLIKDQIDACSQQGCYIELVPGQTYYESEPWNLRNKEDLTIRGFGNVVFFTLPTENTPSLMIDATGARRLHFVHWKMSNRSIDGKPEVGLVLSRNLDLSSSDFHYFERWRTQGWWSKAAIYSIASEVNTWEHCFLGNSHSNATVFYTGRKNRFNIVSPFGPAFGESTNTCIDFFNTSVVNYGHHMGPSPDQVGIWIGGGTRDFHIWGGSASGAVEGKAHLRISGSNNNTIVLHGAELETKGVDNCIWIDDTANVHNLAVRSSLLQSKHSAVKVDGIMFWSVFESNQYWNADGFAIEITDNSHRVERNWFHIREETDISAPDGFLDLNRVTVWNSPNFVGKFIAPSTPGKKLVEFAIIDIK